MTFFTSDHHFGHANIIKYCGRPFANVEEMDRELVRRWNARVLPDDDVYHLGDFAFGPAENIGRMLAQLNGRVHLILGNHDRSAARMESFGFASVHRELVLDLPMDAAASTADGDGGSIWVGSVYLSHRPIADRRMPIHLCGHVHETWSRRGHIINVGVDVRDFEPKTLEELLA